MKRKLKGFDLAKQWEMREPPDFAYNTYYSFAEKEVRDVLWHHIKTTQFELCVTKGKVELRSFSDFCGLPDARVSLRHLMTDQYVAFSLEPPRMLAIASEFEKEAKALRRRAAKILKESP